MEKIGQPAEGCSVGHGGKSPSHCVGRPHRDSRWTVGWLIEFDKGMRTHVLVDDRR